MTELTPKDLFLESLERCAADDAFIPAFYERFLSSSDEVRFKFRNTDFERQNKMLLQSLRLSAGATAGNPDSLRELKERAETHSSVNLNIRPELYDLWLTAVIETAGSFDPQCDETTEDAWRSILGHVIHHMIRYY